MPLAYAEEKQERENINIIIQQIDDLISPIDTDKPSVVYVFDQVDRIGQLAVELFTFRSLFPIENFSLIVIVSGTRLRSARVNLTVFEAFTRQMTVVKTEDALVCLLGQQNLGLIETNCRQYLLIHSYIMCRLTMFEVMGKGIAATMTLSGLDQLKGTRLKKSLGVDHEAPIIALHVREPSFLPGMPEHDYRDADIAQYTPLIQRLLADGYIIARIGDKTMRPLKMQHPNLIDTPFLAQYDPFMDLYFVAASYIFVCTFSGPQSISMAYNTPSLIANCPITSHSTRGDSDLLLPKKYYSNRLKRALSYEEITLSDIPEFVRSKEFTKAHLTLLENSPDEIMSSFNELDHRLQGSYPIDTALAKRIATLNQVGHLMREKDLVPQTESNLSINFFAPVFSKSDLSHEYIKMNPGFIHN